MTSATPIEPTSSRSVSSSGTPISAPGLSNGEAGTQLDAQTPKVNGRRGRGLGQRGDAGHAEDVRDLVRIGGDGGRAVGQHRAHELVDPELRRLEVHVAVDETRSEGRAADVDGVDGVAPTPAGNDAVGDRELGLDPLARVRDEHATAGDEQVRGFVAPGDGEGSAGSGAAHLAMLGAHVGTDAR